MRFLSKFARQGRFALFFRVLDDYQQKIFAIVDKSLKEKLGDVPETIATEIAIFASVTPGKTENRTDLIQHAYAAALSRDDTLLLVGTRSGHLEIWDVENWKMLRKRKTITRTHMEHVRSA